MNMLMCLQGHCYMLIPSGKKIPWFAVAMEK